MKFLTTALLAVSVFTPAAWSAGNYDAYSGWLKLKGDKTGYFHTQQIQGRWWLVTPGGNAFFSKGVDNVSFVSESDDSPKAPDDPTAWAKATSRQLHEWNFNTAGAWSASQLYAAGIVLRSGDQHGCRGATGRLA
jgi:hypothetical protein